MAAKRSMPNPVLLAGHPLDSDTIAKGKVITWRHKPALRYRWAAGVAIGRFLGGLKEGRILARKCLSCGTVGVPPRMFCEVCFRPTDEWVELQHTGRVNTVSTCYIATDASRMKDPMFPAVIEIDGAGGNGILHVLGEVTPKEVAIGMEVEAVFKPADQRTGDITDIRYWRPRKSKGAAAGSSARKGGPR